MPSITLFSRPARRSFPKLGRNVLPFVEMARTAERSLASPLLAYRAAETSAREQVGISCHFGELGANP